MIIVRAENLVKPINSEYGDNEGIPKDLFKESLQWYDIINLKKEANCDHWQGRASSSPIQDGPAIFRLLRY